MFSALFAMLVITVILFFLLGIGAYLIFGGPQS